MALEEFEEEPLTNRQKAYLRTRSIVDYSMGLLWMSMGVFLLFKKYFDVNIAMELDDPAFKILGGICVIYGIFRMYRAYKKNYYKDR